MRHLTALLMFSLVAGCATPAAPPANVGSASMSPDHVIRLDLIGTTPEGMTAHGVRLYSPADPHYAEVLSHLGGLEPGEVKPIPPWPPEKTGEAACAVAKSAVSTRDHFPISAIAFCDILPAESGPEGYRVLALHGRRPDCGGICSTNMGWFAVQKTTGRVFEWDMGEQELGAPIGAGP